MPITLSRMVTGSLNSFANTLNFTGASVLKAGDFNNDDSINIQDLNIFAMNYGSIGSTK